LTDEQVESMILESFDHAEDDFAKVLLIEARNEAETVLAAVERAPQNPAWTLLTEEEQATINGARDRLAEVKKGEDATQIRLATLELDHATRRFAELMMDAAVSSALRGKTMESAGEELSEAVTAPHAMAPAEFK
jgi:molecular chaperone DnaK (HSP70)